MNELDPLVLIVEDEASLRRFIRASLNTHQYRVIEAERASQVTALVASHNPELVLMDLGLPDGDGIDLTKQLRTWSHVPIIVISARGREDDKVAALDAGADDYLTKPFGVGELLARMRVAFRHVRGLAQVEPMEELNFGELKVNLMSRVVTRAGAELHLTPIEYKLLALFAKHAGKVLTHRFILSEIWGPASATQTHNVRVHMAELRRKIEPDAARSSLFVTEPGVGYRLREPH